MFNKFRKIVNRDI